MKDKNLDKKLIECLISGIKVSNLKIKNKTIKTIIMRNITLIALLGSTQAVNIRDPAAAGTATNGYHPVSAHDSIK